MPVPKIPLNFFWESVWFFLSIYQLVIVSFSQLFILMNRVEQSKQLSFPLALICTLAEPSPKWNKQT